ncbi:MAG TPA: hypothetical protein DEB24_01300 [Coriobacteriia bacterium]|nr:hypothetical protein [Coriobacteriia bacterium]
MIFLKHLARIGRSTLLSSLLLLALLMLPFTYTGAHAAAAEAETTSTSNPGTVEQLSEAPKGSLAFLYCPELTWDDLLSGLAELDAAGKAGTLTFLGESGFANLSAPNDPGLSDLLKTTDVGAYRYSGNTGAADMLVAIQDFINTELPENAVLVIVAAPLFDGGEPSREFTPIIIRGDNHSGLMSSEITHRQGLITATDLVVLHANLEKRQGHTPVIDITATNGLDKSTLVNKTAETDVISRIQRLAQEDATIESMTTTKQYISMAFLGFVFATFTLSILLLVLGRRDKPGSRKLLVPAVRILWLLVLAFPIATFLMFLILPARPSPVDLIFALLIWIAISSIGALLIGYTTKWVNSLITLFALTIVVVLWGQLLGGPLSSAGYLTYDITEGSRYYGMGNEQGAMLFGSWITLSGLLINRFPDARAIPFFKKWGFALGSLALLFVSTSPWFGASFGPLVWGFIGCFFSWWLFNGRRLKWWLILIMVVAAFALALTVLYADIALNPASHMHQVLPSAGDGLMAVVTRIASDVWAYSFALIRDYVPLVAIVFFVFTFILLVVLRVLKPGTYREFWARNVAFRISYSVCFVLASLTFIIEDSGIFTPAMLIIYPVAGFVWLICDLHSWHLRMLDEDGPPLTIKQLQREALDLLLHKNAGKQTREEEDDK